MSADPGAARDPRKERRRALMAVAVVLIAVLLGLGLAAITGGGEAQPLATGLEDAVEILVEEATHVTGDVTYDRFPPAGGPHDPAWANCGVYTEPVRPENAVHSMEHGAVWVVYDPATVEAALVRDVLGGLPHVLVSPAADIPAPAVATAWGRQLQLDGIEDPRLEQFLRAFVQGPQTPEPGAPCTGGVGQPVG